MPGLRAPVFLAKEMGKGVGRGKILQQYLQKP